MWRRKGEYAILPFVVLRACKVSVRDIRDVEHTVDVTAETLYEAVASALTALQQDNWVGEIPEGLNTVRVLVQQPPINHEVRMQDFCHGLVAREDRQPKSCFGRRYRNFWVGRLPQRHNHWVQSVDGFFS
jgi:hypothetical protein